MVGDTYEVGDEVTILSWDEMEELYGLNHDGIIPCTFNFTQEMRDCGLCGATRRIATRRRMTSGNVLYRFEGSPYAFSADMFRSPDDNREYEDISLDSLLNIIRA